MNCRTISLIARYEMKAITREWSFKIVILLSVLIVTLLHLITLLENPQWIAISLPSAIPFTNAYLVNFLQIILAVFWAGNFLKEEKYQDTNSSVSVRPFSNIELLFGKTFGFLIIIFCLDIVLGGIAMFIHVFATESPFAFYPYIFYFFTLTCPALLFATGLVICVKGMIRNFALSSVIILALLYFALFPGKYLLHGIFDPLALGLPNAFSDFTGFPELSNYLLQRFTFLAWGCGLIILGITFISRISNSSKTNFASGRVGILFLMFGVIVSGIYVGKHVLQSHERKVVRGVFVKYQNVPKISVLEHDIEFKQEGYTYLSSSKLKLFNQNEQKVDSVILYLNPGLEVLKLTSGIEDIVHYREQQVLVLSISMQPGETREIKMDYQGSISPAICYSEIENIGSLAAIARGYYMYNMGRDYYYLQPDYTLLTPECLWYPTSVPPVNVASPYFSDQDFTRFKLLVCGEDKRTVIAQGEKTEKDGNIAFTSKFRLPGLTLCIGEYERKGIEESGILYEVFLLKGHENLLPKEIDPKKVVEFWTAENQIKKGRAYVFDKLNLVETPVHFCAYGREWKNSSEYIHPEIIYRPEREALLEYDFLKSNIINDKDPAENFLVRYSRSFSYSSRDLLEKNMFFEQLVRHHARNKIKNENNISELIQKYHYNVYSSEFAGINLLFHRMLDRFYASSEYWGGGTNKYFEEHSLGEALQKPNRDIDLKDAIYLKGDYFIKYLLYAISCQEFERFNTVFMECHNFQCFSYEDYCEKIKKEFGINLLELTRKLYHEKGLPAFYFRDARVDVVETSNGEEDGYVFSIKVWNKGNIEGLISLNDSDLKEWQNYIIPAGACKEIKTYFKGVPEEFEIELCTNLSRNDPWSFVFREFSSITAIKKPIEGIFDTDTFAFASETGVYIVDNEDPGFRIVEDRRMLDKTYKQAKRSNSYKGSHWNLMYLGDEGYGELSKKFLEKKSNEGISAVEWEISLPESGEYEVFVYNIRSYADLVYGDRIRREGKGSPIQTYRLTCVNGEKEVEMAPLDSEQGWVSLGVYSINSGLAKVRLSGQGSDPRQTIIADAVKWVKVK